MIRSKILRLCLPLLALVAVVIPLAFTACTSTTVSDNQTAPEAVPHSDNQTAPEAVPPVDAPSSTGPSASLLERIPRITIYELLQKMAYNSNILIVDTRHADQYEVDHIKGAISVPMDTIIAGDWTPPADKELILYCGWPDEKTSARAAFELIDKGFGNVKVLKGGYDAWKAGGYAMETGSQ